MNKRGVGVEQVFIFIVVAITFGLIVIFGYNAIADFLVKGKQVEFVQFKTDLEAAVKRLSTEYGSVRVEEFYLPADYRQICFVDMDYPPSPDEQEQLCQNDQLACQVWKQAQQAPEEQEEGKPGSAGVDENVFLKPAALVPIKVSLIHLGSPGFLCQKISDGRFTLRLEGKGSYTQVGRAE